MSDRLNGREGMFEPGQIVSYDHWNGLSNNPEKVKLLLLSKTQNGYPSYQQNGGFSRKDVPAIWRAYYLSGSTGVYINMDQGHKDKNLVLVFEYALEL